MDNWAQPLDTKQAGMPTAFQTPGAGATLNPQTGKADWLEKDPAAENGEIQEIPSGGETFLPRFR